MNYVVEEHREETSKQFGKNKPLQKPMFPGAEFQVLSLIVSFSRDLIRIWSIAIWGNLALYVRFQVQHVFSSSETIDKRKSFVMSLIYEPSRQVPLTGADYFSFK